MKFGLHYLLASSLSQSQVACYDDTLNEVVHAETLGFDSVWPVEQHFNPASSMLPAPLLLLSAISQRTRTMRLGTAVILLPLAHPLRVAEEVAMLDILSHGRVEFGIGRGQIGAHFRGFGVDQTENRERFLESLDIVRKAWTQERVSHKGRFFEIDGIAVEPKPVQKPFPPIRVAANSRDTFEQMGRLGYPIFVALHINPFPRLREYISIYLEARRSAGHPDLHGDEVTILIGLYVGEDYAQIQREAEPSLRHALSQLSETTRRMSYEELNHSIVIFDTPEGCVGYLKRVEEELHVGRVILLFNFGGQIRHDLVMRSMELFAAKVMPHFLSAEPRPGPPATAALAPATPGPRDPGATAAWSATPVTRDHSLKHRIG